ncbi:hypothetical protein AAFF_G00363860 [Aldrovandia affinis]|uniref:Cyclic GMP-AMP synthase n=1 Tax=Aldrovandia affinis TaxID=143900 RepID=A0AAD7SHM3_9TELE|nr:hypothetical protein AAFF_G00363860 [Aldrovandia affinis]
MTGRGRTNSAKTKEDQDQGGPAHSRSCTTGRGSPPHGKTAKHKSEQRTSNPRGASGDASTAKTKKTGSPASGAVGSSSQESPPPESNGDLKLKDKNKSSRLGCVDMVKANTTGSPASGAVGCNSRGPQQPKSRVELNPKPKVYNKNGTCPSLDGPTSVDKKTEKTAKKDGLDASTNKVLLSTLDQLKIKMTAKSESSTVINEIVSKIITYMKQKSEYFRDVEKLHTGSYYENVKISEPDEFDVMLTIPVDRVDLHMFDSDGAFYSVALKRTPRTNPLRCFLQDDNTISASKMLNEFRDHVKKSVESFPDVVVERKKKGCPAVTLLVKHNGMEIGLDIVLSLEVRGSWPGFTQDGLAIDSWLGKKVKKEFKFKPFYLVPKFVGKADEERDGVCAKDVWRISFSHVEKAILMNHGQAKTCCEEGGRKCCRKPCLKLLKHILQRLKQKHPKELSNFFSYLCKTTLLHACSVRVKDSDWEMDNLSNCFLRLLEDFEGHLRRGTLPNFFIPAHNLLGSGCNKKNRDFLANCIERERKNDFPIFRDCS